MQYMLFSFYKVETSSEVFYYHFIAWGISAYSEMRRGGGSGRAILGQILATFTATKLRLFPPSICFDYPFSLNYPQAPHQMVALDIEMGSQWIQIPILQALRICEPFFQLCI